MAAAVAAMGDIGQSASSFAEVIAKRQRRPMLASGYEPLNDAIDAYQGGLKEPLKEWETQTTDDAFAWQQRPMSQVNAQERGPVYERWAKGMQGQLTQKLGVYQRALAARFDKLKPQWLATVQTLGSIYKPSADFPNTEFAVAYGQKEAVSKFDTYQDEHRSALQEWHGSLLGSLAVWIQQRSYVSSMGEQEEVFYAYQREILQRTGLAHKAAKVLDTTAKWTKKPKEGIGFVESIPDKIKSLVGFLRKMGSLASGVISKILGAAAGVAMWLKFIPGASGIATGLEYAGKVFEAISLGSDAVDLNRRASGPQIHENDELLALAQERLGSMEDTEKKGFTKAYEADEHDEADWSTILDFIREQFGFGGVSESTREFTRKMATVARYFGFGAAIMELGAPLVALATPIFPPAAPIAAGMLTAGEILGIAAIALNPMVLLKALKKVKDISLGAKKMGHKAGLYVRKAWDWAWGNEAHRDPKELDILDDAEADKDRLDVETQKGFNIMVGARLLRFHEWIDERKAGFFSQVSGRQFALSLLNNPQHVLQETALYLAKDSMALRQLVAREEAPILTWVPMVSKEREAWAGRWKAKVLALYKLGEPELQRAGVRFDEFWQDANKEFSSDLANAETKVRNLTFSTIEWMDRSIESVFATLRRAYAVFSNQYLPINPNTFPQPLIGPLAGASNPNDTATTGARSDSKFVDETRLKLEKGVVPKTQNFKPVGTFTSKDIRDYTAVQIEMMTAGIYLGEDLPDFPADRNSMLFKRDAADTGKKAKSIVAQKKGIGGAHSNSGLGSLAQNLGQGQRLEGHARERIAQHVGFDPAIARLHTGGQAAHAASEMGAEAFTVGQDVYFGENRFDPGSRQGQALIGHELTHVAQQMGGHTRNLGHEGTPGMRQLEHKAVEMEHRILKDGDSSAELVAKEIHVEIEPMEGMDSDPAVEEKIKKLGVEAYVEAFKLVKKSNVVLEELIVDFEIDVERLNDVTLVSRWTKAIVAAANAFVREEPMGVHVAPPAVEVGENVPVWHEEEDEPLIRRSPAEIAAMRGVEMPEDVPVWQDDEAVVQRKGNGKAKPKPAVDPGDYREFRKEALKASEAAGVDVGLLTDIAYFESSGFKKDIKSPLSSAVGYGQFLDSTWQEMFRKYGENYLTDSEKGELKTLRDKVDEKRNSIPPKPEPSKDEAENKKRQKSYAEELKAAKAAIQEAEKNVKSKVSELGVSHRKDASAQAGLLAHFTKENLDRVAKINAETGRTSNIDPNADAYIMHNLGSGDGSAFVRQLGTSDAVSMREFLISNRPVPKKIEESLRANLLKKATEAKKDSKDKSLTDDEAKKLEADLVEAKREWQNDIASSIIQSNKSLYTDGHGTEVTVAEAYENMKRMIHRGDSYAEDAKAIKAGTKTETDQTPDEAAAAALAAKEAEEAKKATEAAAKKAEDDAKKLQKTQKPPKSKSIPNKPKILD